MAWLRSPTACNLIYRGLTFDAARQVLDGTPTTQGTYDMTYTATDAGGEAAVLRFVITVELAPDNYDGNYYVQGIVVWDLVDDNRERPSTDCTEPLWSAGKQKFPLDREGS